jgi:hypothetical protein
MALVVVATRDRLAEVRHDSFRVVISAWERARLFENNSLHY